MRCSPPVNYAYHKMLLNENESHLVLVAKYLDRNQYNLFRHNDSRLGSMTVFHSETDFVYT